VNLLRGGSSDAPLIVTCKVRAVHYAPICLAGALAVIRYAKLHGTKHRPWLTALLARRPNHGARAALGKAGGKQDPRSRWLASLRQRRHVNVAAVALANKNARIVWAMLAGNVSYELERSVQAA